MARLAATVVLVKEFTGEPVVFNPGDEPPKWAADQITNPKAWAPEEESTPDGDGDGSGTSGDEGPEEPPRVGKGSGVKAWQEYAEAIGVEVPDGASRDEIIAAVDASKDGDGDDPVEPPREGEGSELEAWQAYAEAIGFDVPEDATREEIIAAIDDDSEDSDA